MSSGQDGISRVIMETGNIIQSTARDPFGRLPIGQTRASILTMVFNGLLVLWKEDSETEVRLIQLVKFAGAK